MKILVIEDNLVTGQIFKSVLEHAFGVEVIVRGEAVDVCKMIIKEKPDLVIMDIDLPNISGLEAVSMIRQDNLTKNVPVVVASGYSSSEFASVAKKLDCEGYIEKPVNYEELVSIVAATLNIEARDFEGL